MTVSSMLIGQKIRQLREAEGLTRSQFTDLTGIKADTLSQIETGRRKTVNSDTLEMITKNHQLQKFTLWLLTDNSAPEIGQVTPGETAPLMRGNGVPAELLNNAFERTVTTSIELGWLSAQPGVKFSMLADLFRRDFVSEGGVISTPAVDETSAKTG